MTPPHSPAAAPTASDSPRDAPPDLLARLRAATRPQHDAIEGVVDVLRPDLTAARYRRLLEAFYGFYAPWEAAAAAPAETRDLVLDRRKTPLLERDLAHWGLNAVDRAALPRCRALPPLDTAARVLGSLYVLEGATLGGQVIARHVEATLGVAPGAGDAFFRSYGDRVGAMWQAFRDRVRARSSPLWDPPIIRSGCDTFSALHNWLAQQLGVSESSEGT